VRRWYGRLLQLRFRLFQRQRYSALALEYIDERPFIVLPQVLNPALFAASTFFARALQAEWFPPAAEVLDLGTGSGIAAIYAAQHARSVVAIDLNPQAVRCARINMLLNHVEDRVAVLEGDLFLPIGDRRFNVILFNPPFFRGEPRTQLDKAWRGVDVIDRFVAGLRAHLALDGCALLVYSSVGDTIGLLQILDRHNFKVAVVEQRDIMSEVLTIYRVSD
jgi:release factor glutamine methyltransferase